MDHAPLPIYSKIVATIGPATCTPEALKALEKAGMSVARLNGSHADLDWHRTAIGLIRQVLPHVPILLDIPGRKIRTLLLAHEPSFAEGETLVLTTDPDHDGREKVPVNYPDLHRDVLPGSIIMADDGTLSFEVIQVRDRDIICAARTAGTLRSRKGINVPFVQLNTALVTERDRAMTSFARELGVDFIGISFVESAAHVEAIRNLVGARSPQILAKVENQGGMDHLEEIVAAADAIMIDRGDLSVETRLETMAIYQKKIIDAARAEGKPVIVATEMLHSMIRNNMPTKAEIADITNAVLDGCSATMLSGETAIGDYPLEAVSVMRRVADTAFGHLNARSAQRSAALNLKPAQAVEEAIAMILRSVSVTKVVAITRSGYAARRLSARGVSQPILAVGDNPSMARAFNLYAGVEGIHFQTDVPRGSARYTKACLRFLYETGKLTAADEILVTGALYPRSGTRMNLIQLHKVGDLAAEFGWSAVQGRALANPAAAA
ncbi:MAG TPA: pyruvate kinase [Rhizomicrobium sp.]|nr:pyruvate kinase [Rhizomicrobium sp.]